MSERAFRAQAMAIETQSGRILAVGANDEVRRAGGQATELVDKFLDDAALAHLPQVRIIHGHGTGALRKGLAEYLKTQPLVARASFAAEEHGGKAITIVELRS